MSAEKSAEQRRIGTNSSKISVCYRRESAGKNQGCKNHLPQMSAEKVRRSAQNRDKFLENQRLFSARISRKKSTEKSPPADVRRKGSQISAESG